MKETLEQLARALLSRFGEASTRRRRQREAILASPFPPLWIELLQTRCEHYRRLPPVYRDRFKDQTQVFLAEKRITGVEMEVSEETRLLVAASAISLTVGWPDYTWDQLAEVLLYPQDFDRDYNFGGTDASGTAHPWGVVIISVPALNRSFDESSDGYHVGFHEFAHLDPYALSGSVEFFATAVEAFLEIPTAVADRHGELYAFLSTYFCQDPASWSEVARP